MAAIDNALTTIANAKQFLNITGTSKDLLLKMLILGASSYIQNTYCGQKFAAAARTNELYDGKDSPRIFLRCNLIDSGETFTLQQRSGTDWETLEADKYVVYYNQGYVQLLNGNFCAGPQNVRVSYTGGYIMPSNGAYESDENADLPYDLQLACLDMVAMLYKLRTASGLKRQKVRDVELEYKDVLDKNPAIKLTLDKYKLVSYA